MKDENDMTIKMTHTVTIRWNDKSPVPGANLSGNFADTLVWPNGREDLFSRMALEARGITPPRIFKVGDWVRVKVFGEWSSCAYQVGKANEFGEVVLLGSAGVRHTHSLMFVAEGTLLSNQEVS